MDAATRTTRTAEGAASESPGALSGLILAGGAGTRLGGTDKARLRIGTSHTSSAPGPKLIDLVAARLQPQVGALVISHPEGVATAAAHRSDPPSDLARWGSVIADDPRWQTPAVVDTTSQSLSGGDAARDKPRSGPLAGLLTALERHPERRWVVVPVDAPQLAPDLATRLLAAHEAAYAAGQAPLLTIAHDGQRLQPLFALVEPTAREPLATGFAAGQRSLMRLLNTIAHAVADFSDQPEAFANINTAEDLAVFADMTAPPSPATRSPDLAPKSLPGSSCNPSRSTAPETTPAASARADSTPVQKANHEPLRFVAFCGRSGSGKTTLLLGVLEWLAADRCTPPLAVIKHTHHDLQFDVAGKDSRRLREAAAAPTLLVSRHESQLVIPHDEAEMNLDDAATLDRWGAWLPRATRLAIIEGCRHCRHRALWKIEVYRPPVSDTLLAMSDPAVRAIAAPSDLHDRLRKTLATATGAAAAHDRPTLLDLDDPAGCGAWLLQQLGADPPDANPPATSSTDASPASHRRQRGPQHDPGDAPPR